MKNKKRFKRHFRIYFLNNHPAYIVDEEDNMYVFHRVTHSKTSGGKKNWNFENPLLYGGNGRMYIVKKQQKDKKKRFSSFELELKRGADVSFPSIKKVGNESDTGSHQALSRSRYESSKNIKTKRSKNIKSN